MNEDLTTEEKVPDYLKKYIYSQDYDSYTDRDQAVWRFVMRNAQKFFAETAHPIYLEGLEKTGISIDKIPKIVEMDRVLNQFGWGAVCVNGFIPPLAFLDFQSRKILPIAGDMRTLEHIDYTPAPDIVHEAAGHAPIIADEGYRNYLSRYAELARRAIFSSEDIRVYEAIRNLSDKKENPDSSAEDIELAGLQLHEAEKNVSYVTEAAQVARYYWWTAEYGLVGSLENPRIYGAGLLSSIGEAQSCLGSEVGKIPLDLKCLKQGYDITCPQPQLFVAPTFEHLIDDLDQLKETMAFCLGGVEGLAIAKKAQTVTTTVLDTGLSISGVVTEYLMDKGQPSYLRYEGECQIAKGDEEVAGHGRERHGHGYSCPIGLLEGMDKSLAYWSEADLQAQGVLLGSKCKLTFRSGIVVEGVLQNIQKWNESLNGIFTFSDCLVTLENSILFRPEWGEFDLLAGESVTSVYGGPADWGAYGEHEIGHASTTPGRMSPYTPAEKQVFELYEAVKNLRESGTAQEVLSQFPGLVADLLSKGSNEWLLGMELAELVYQYDLQSEAAEELNKLQESVLLVERYQPRVQKLIMGGMSIYCS